MIARFFALLLAALWAVPAGAADSAALLMYHRFGDGRHPSTNIRLDQFDAHLAALRAGGYTVLPLPVIVDALRNGRSLPDKAVAITVDDAWASVYAHAWPRLKSAGLPFTVFVATDETDRGGPEMMTWDQIRELAASGLVTIGAHGAAHAHMAAMTPDQVAEDLARSRRRLAEELGAAPDLLAWPYGETSARAMAVARKTGFAVAFGQHSGIIWGGADMFTLPRFALNESYGEIGRFKQAVAALPLRAIDVIPDDPLLAANPPALSFTVKGGADKTLTCYASHLGRVAHRMDGDRVRVVLDKPFPPGRGRVNCTAPGPDGRWKWFGWQVVVP